MMLGVYIWVAYISKCAVVPRWFMIETGVKTLEYDFQQEIHYYY